MRFSPLLRFRDLVRIGSGLRYSLFWVAGYYCPRLSSYLSVHLNFIWCSWEQLAQEMSALESNSQQPVQVYAYEDLVAYHLWFSLESVEKNEFKVTVVKGLPGITEDPAYFLPRAFTDISVQKNPALTGDKIWVAFRGEQWDETRPPLDGIRRGGFQIGRVLTVKAQRQQAFLRRTSERLEMGHEKGVRNRRIECNLQVAALPISS